MTPPLDTVSFLSDYGTADEFVGVVKSVIRQIAPARHGDRPHPRDRPATTSGPAALALARAAQYLAPGVVLAVVDPGSAPTAGRSRSRSATGESVLVGPDNGLLAPAVAMVGGADPGRRAHQPRATTSSAPGPTFAGRDVFAPAAAHLCNGVDARRSSGPRSTRSRCCPGILPLTPGGGRRARRRGAVGRPLRQRPAQRRSRRDRRPAATGCGCVIGEPARSGAPGPHLRRRSARARSAWSSTPTVWSPSSLDRRSAAEELGLDAGDAVRLEPFDEGDDAGAQHAVASPVRLSSRPGAAMRPGTTIVLALLLVLIFGAALIQFVFLAR